VVALVELTGVFRAQPGDAASTTDGHQVDFPFHARFERHLGACRYVEPVPPGGGTVEVQRGVHRGEVVVGADLHGAVGAVDDGDSDAFPPRVERDRFFGGDDFSRTHGSSLVTGAGRCAPAMSRGTQWPAVFLGEAEHRRAARFHAMGSWTVTSLVPSGKVASTCTSRIMSGTPARTWSAVSTWRPLRISSATDRPSRAPSTTWSVIRATASG